MQHFANTILQGFANIIYATFAQILRICELMNFDSPRRAHRFLYITFYARQFVIGNIHCMYISTRQFGHKVHTNDDR